MTSLCLAVGPWIALIERGECNFTVKMETAAAHGAIGVVVINSDNTTLLMKHGKEAPPSPHSGLYTRDSYALPPHTAAYIPEIATPSLTVCPLPGPSHVCSVGERMYLTVPPLHGPGRNSSVGE